MNGELMKRTEAADYLGVSTKTLLSWEEQEPTFPKAKTIAGSPYYVKSDLDTWLKADTSKLVTGNTEVLKSLIREILARAIQNQTERAIIMSQVTPDMLNDELHMIYALMYKRRGHGGDIDKQFLTIALTRNPEYVQGNKNIDLEPYKQLEGDTIALFIKNVLDTYDAIIIQKPSNEPIDLILDKFLQEYKYMRTLAILQNAGIAFQTGLRNGKQLLVGAEGAREYLQNSFSQLDTQLDKEAGTGINIAREDAMSDENAVRIQIGDFGDMQFLTDHFGGIRTSQLINVLAPPKTGKTKLLCRLAYNSLTKYKQAVVFWPAEGGKQKLFAEMRAIHFSEMYNNGVADLKLSARNIMQNDYPGSSTEEKENIKQLESNSRADLFASGKYGNLWTIDKPLQLETFEAFIRDAVKRSGATSVYIDYLQLISSASGRLAAHEVVAKAYQKALLLSKELGIAIISPAQYKQDAIQALMAGEDYDLRTAGGSSAEVIRSADINLALYATPEKLIEGELTLKCIPSRDYEGFSDRKVYIDYAIDYFADIVEEE